MYLQTLASLLTQLPKVPLKNQKSLSKQNLPKRTFCSGRNVLVTCGQSALEIWLLNWGKIVFFFSNNFTQNSHLCLWLLYEKAHL